MPNSTEPIEAPVLPDEALRLHVEYVLVRPVLIWDDGETITDGPVTEPVKLALADLDTLGEKIRANVAQIANDLRIDEIERRAAAQQDRAAGR